MIRSNITYKDKSLIVLLYKTIVRLHINHALVHTGNQQKRAGIHTQIIIQGLFNKYNKQPR